MPSPLSVDTGGEATQAFRRPLERALCSDHVDVVRPFTGRGQHAHTFAQDFGKPPSDRKRLVMTAATHDHLTGFQSHDHRMVARPYTKRSSHTRHHDLIGLGRQHAPVRSQDLECDLVRQHGEFLQETLESVRAFSRASSMVPTM